MKTLFLFLLFISSQALAVVTELKTYKELDLKAIDANTLVVFDIDNTLIRQDSMIGTHQWGDAFRERAIRQGVPEKGAKEMQHRGFASIQPHVKVVPVENEIYKVLKSLTARKIPHFALTARPDFVMDTTLKQIQILKHDFVKSFPAQKDFGPLKAYLKGGVIFSGETPKGELLKMIIENAVVKPTKVIFVDDKLYNLESVEKSLNPTGIKLTSLRYGAADAFVSGFDPKIADIEYGIFKEAKILISDEDAKKYVDNLKDLVQLRFDLYSQRYDSVIQSGDCVEVKALSYHCSFYAGDDSESTFFYFYRDTHSNSIYF